MRNVIVTFVVALSTIACLARLTFAEPPKAKDETAKPKVAADSEKPKPDDAVRRMADYLGNLPAFSCRIESTLEIKAKGVDNHMTTKMVARLQRPNRFALVVEEGEMGMTLISDGKQLVQYMPALKRYTVNDAPADLADLSKAGESRAMGIMSMAPIPTSGNEFYKSIMTGVTKSEFLGTEKLGDNQCQHFRFEQENFTWDMWIDTGDKPFVRKVSPDFSKRFANSGGPLKDAKMSYSVVFSDWNPAPKFTDADFKFTPPGDAEKVDSLFEAAGREEEGPHPLLGKAAPPIETVDLDEHPIDLKKDFGKNVILLDFWATWCGPCVAAMPKVDAVAKKFADKGLVFRAVNVGEDAKTIKDFLESSKLDPPVAMDTKNEIAQAYKVSGIPQTVLIGKDGKVQVVHVGFSENLGDMLSKEIEDLLAGKDLAGPELQKAEKARKKQAVSKKHVEPDGVTQAWKVSGRWSGVDAHAASNTLYAVGSDNDAAAIDAAGKIQKKFPTERGGILRLAKLATDASPVLLIYQGWGAGVKAYSATGESLWDYPGGDGVDDVWPADLNGDGTDEVIVGYNGGTGLHVLDQGGKPLWKFNEIGNVWHVAAGDFNNDGKPEVITTSAAGKLHVFDAAGHKLKDISVSLYAYMVRMAKLGKDTMAIVNGSGGGAEKLIAVNYDGQEKWSIDLSQVKGDHVDDMSIATSRPWAAVAMRGGVIHIVDLDSARIVARAAEQGMTPHVAWLPRKDLSPLLVVATGSELNAFEVTPTDVASKPEAESKLAPVTEADVKPADKK